MSEDAADSRPESSGDARTGNGRWPKLPDGVTVAPGIALDSDDPAFDPDRGRRFCIALAASTGTRCSAPPGLDSLLCSAHGGRLDSAAGGRAKAARIHEVRLAAENRVAERSLGVRAALSAELQRRQDDVIAIVNALVDDAKAGNMKAAALLLPYLDQALGKPAPVEDKKASLAGELSSMSEAELAEIVRKGRAANRLKAV